MRALLLCLLLCTSAVAAAPSGARDDIALATPAIDIDLSGDYPAIAVAIDDEGGSSPVNGPASQTTWYLYDILKSTVSGKQFGSADAPDCGGFNVDDDCNTPPVAVAMNANGERMVVAAVADPGQSQLIFIDRTKGPVSHLAVDGRIVALDMDDAGDDVVVSIDTTQTPTGGHAVTWYNWGSTATQAWSKTTSASGAIDISPDGLRAIALAGSEVRIYTKTSSTPFIDSQSPGSFTAAAVATDGHISVAGLSSGTLRVYSDESTAGATRDLNFPGNSRVDAVAITEDGRRVAVGRADGTLTIFTIDIKPVRGYDEVYNQDIGSGITSLQFSGDSDYLLVGVGNDVRLLTPAGDLLWKDTLPAQPTSLSIDHDGSFVAAAWGSTLRIYEEIHELAVTMPKVGTLTPGQAYTLTALLDNQGNRISAGTLAIDGPADWNLTLAQDTFEILPDQQLQLTMRFTVNATSPAGDEVITLTVDDGTATPYTMDVAVAERVAWHVAPSGPTSLPVQAGATVDFALMLHNNGNLAGTPPLDIVSTTAQWTAELIGVPDTMAPGASKEVFVRVASPEKAADLSVGTIQYGLEGASPRTLTATVGATFRVGLEGITTIAMPAGESRALSLVLRNDGNAPDSFALTLGAVAPTWTMSFGNGATQYLISDVPAGGTRAVVIDIDAPITGSNTAATLTATSRADPTVSVERVITATAVAPEPSEPEPEPKDKKQPGFALIGAVVALALAACRR